MATTKDEKTRLVMQAAQLTQEERFCLSGYLYVVSNNNITELDARVMAYKLSRTKKALKTENNLSIKRLADRLFQSDKVKAYMRLQQIAKEEGIQDEPTPEASTDIEDTNIDDEEKQANKLYGELEQLKAGANADTMIKLVNAQQNILHKNKDNFKEDNKQVRYYLPLRCYDCELHKRAEKEL